MWSITETYDVVQIYSIMIDANWDCLIKLRARLFIFVVWKYLHLVYYCDVTIVPLTDCISVNEHKLSMLIILVAIMLFYGCNWWYARGCEPARVDLIRNIVWLHLEPYESPLCVDMIIAGLRYYLLSLRVRKPSSSTLPYCFEWDFDLRKHVTAERANSIGFFWQTFTSEPGSGPLEPTGPK